MLSSECFSPETLVQGWLASLQLVGKDHGRLNGTGKVRADQKRACLGRHIIL